MGPVTGKAATGTPQAIASSITRPKVSVWLGKTSTLARFNSDTSAWPFSTPVNRTSGNRCCSDSRAGPSPMTSFRPGRSNVRNDSTFFSIETRPRYANSGTVETFASSDGLNSSVSTPRPHRLRLRKPRRSNIDCISRVETMVWAAASWNQRM